MHHWNHGERERVLAEFKSVAIRNLNDIVARTDVIVSAHHVEGLLVAYDACLGIVLLDERQGTAMVGFDVVDDDVVDGAVAYYRAYVGEKLREEVYLNSIDECYLLIVDYVRVVRNAVGQRPKSLEDVLMTVVHADIMY